MRLRGREVMQAFQKAYPGLTVFLTLGYSYPWRQMNNGARPLKESSYGLLAPFLDGMVDAAKGKTRIVDGHENAYRYREPQRFPEAYQMMQRGLLPLVADPRRYARCFRFSFGIWMDGEQQGARGDGCQGIQAQDLANAPRQGRDWHALRVNPQRVMAGFGQLPQGRIQAALGWIMHGVHPSSLAGNLRLSQHTDAGLAQEQARLRQLVC